MKSVRYAITVQGQLGSAARSAFSGMVVSAADDDVTTVEADLDQAGLFGILLRVQSLALELVGVTRVDSSVTGAADLQAHERGAASA